MAAASVALTAAGAPLDRELMNELPPFPAIALKLLQIASDNDFSMSELVKLMSADPAFSAQVLRMANSPLVTASQSIRGLLQASTILGLARVRALAITVGVRAYMNDWLGVPAVRACWRHSLACALIAEELARAGFSDQDEAYTAGVIHDIGRLAIAVRWPKEYSGFLNSTDTGLGDVLSAERELVGIDHCIAGRKLVIAWRLPAAFLDIVGRHHEPVTTLDSLDLAIVKRSCQLADSIGFAAACSSTSPDYAKILCGLPEGERKRFEFTASDMALRIATKINLVETL